MRDGEEETMENWDDNKLREVVDTKHGKEKRMPTTDIVRKSIPNLYFIINFILILFFKDM